jgi:hypothetical protein
VCSVECCVASVNDAGDFLFFSRSMTSRGKRLATTKIHRSGSKGLLCGDLKTGYRTHVLFDKAHDRSFLATQLYGCSVAVRKNWAAERPPHRFVGNLCTAPPYAMHNWGITSRDHIPSPRYLVLQHSSVRPLLPITPAQPRRDHPVGGHGAPRRPLQRARRCLLPEEPSRAPAGHY